jgi:DNA-binding NtrC family response regulator
MDLPLRVLIVCSDGECRQRLTDILAIWPMAVTTAPTIGEARKILGEQVILLVLCEEILADGDFRDLLNVAATKQPPMRLIVLVNDERRYTAVMQSGAFDAIPMPCRRSEVQWMVIHALQDEDRPPYPSEHTHNDCVGPPRARASIPHPETRPSTSDSPPLTEQPSSAHRSS